ncbi:MAG: c-type cytochrome, partial [Chitinophagaceae bacterium]|nr:c-type cytochrome [Chitinophagaceae bacterium]
MQVWKYKKTISTIAILALTIGVFIFSTHEQPIDFSTQVKPILNKNCITCHGGVKQQANLSFLFREEALSKTKSGKYAIVPGDPDNSEMICRVNLKDPEERMPYQHDPLSDKEIATLRKWIKQGATWGDHWAYVAVQKQEVPMPKSSFFGLVPPKKIDWVKNDIDYFIYDKLQQQKLQPSAEADKAT